jgi:hypothetical protein
MQQTLQQQNRFGTGASKLLVNQGGAGAIMNGRMMAGGGMGSSLSSGLEDLKKTAGWPTTAVVATASSVALM